MSASEDGTLAPDTGLFASGKEVPAPDTGLLTAGNGVPDPDRGPSAPDVGAVAPGVAWGKARRGGWAHGESAACAGSGEIWFAPLSSLFGSMGGPGGGIGETGRTGVGRSIGR
ncbi:hypothetical protein EDD30_3879 [Couchioplanes caeruleus]|uniref:Uncharacterized protein n=1 Tax=Couchioplanes caeruleus TaxID=56438 RepID=A0A3N1GL85_9ACTN|nr:hypothetical protein EDD30_3879 [Couchioplanes caeruleus]